jgi:hypothetical protein
MGSRPEHESGLGKRAEARQVELTFFRWMGLRNPMNAKAL